MNYLQLALLITSLFALQEAFYIDVPITRNGHYVLTIRIEQERSVRDLYVAIGEALEIDLEPNIVQAIDCYLYFRGQPLSNGNAPLLATGITQHNEDPVEVTIYIGVHVTRNGHYVSTIRIKEDAVVRDLEAAIVKGFKPRLSEHVVHSIEYYLYFRGQPLTDGNMTLLAAGITQHKGDPVHVSIVITGRFYLKGDPRKTYCTIVVEESDNICFIFRKIADKLKKYEEDIKLTFHEMSIDYNNYCRDENSFLEYFYLMDVITPITVSYNQIIHLFIENEETFTDHFYAMPLDKNMTFKNFMVYVRHKFREHTNLATESHVLLDVENVPIYNTLIDVKLHDDLYIVPINTFTKDQFIELHVEGEDENTTHEIRYYDYTTPQQIISWLGKQKKYYHRISPGYILLNKDHEALEQDQKIVDQGVKSHDTVYLVSEENYKKRRMDAGESSRGTKKTKIEWQH